MQSLNGSGTVERNDACGNILQYGFHQLPPALQFLNRLLKVACDLIDLRPAIPQLRGHGVKGAHKYAEFVLGLLRALVIKIAGRDLSRAFRESLNGDSDLLGKKQSHPHHRRQEEQRKKKENV